jgi:hypothetical protein
MRDAEIALLVAARAETDAGSTGRGMLRAWLVCTT